VIAWAVPADESELVPTWAWAASERFWAKLFAEMANPKDKARRNTDFLLMREFLAPGKVIFRVEPVKVSYYPL
jgi:hypothetical protein